MMAAHPTARRIVLSYGTYDRFDPSQVQFLQNLARLGSDLIVGCATDAFCAETGFYPRYPYQQRRKILESCRFVDRVIRVESLDQQHADIVNYNVSVFAMGANWIGQFDHLEDITSVKYLKTNPEPRTFGAVAAPQLRAVG